jgi:hypothetical protein
MWIQPAQERDQWRAFVSKMLQIFGFHKTREIYWLAQNLVGFQRSWDPESYAGGSIATGRVPHAGQVKG